jgi:2-methylisocitrate lyase-like PEP mutase family enzyme
VTTDSWLSTRLRDPELLVAPGAYDALTAKLIGSSGVEALYCGGFAATASAYGLPDVGLLGMAEMAEVYRRLCTVVDIPVIVDSDTGYGGPLNVRRTVETFRAAGVSAMHIEDQLDPKRCGHLAGKRVLGPQEAQARVHAAASTGREVGMGIIARTDALAVEGLDSVIDRGRRFADAGADAFFVDAVRTTDQIRTIREEVDLPLFFNAATTGVSPALTRAEQVELGFAAVIYPIELLLAALAAGRAMLDDIRAGGVVTPAASFGEINKLLDLDAYVERDRELDGRSG